MKLQYQPSGQTDKGHLTLVAETAPDAKLLGILDRLVRCGDTPRDGVRTLLDCVFESARTATKETEK